MTDKEFINSILNLYASDKDAVDFSLAVGEVCEEYRTTVHHESSTGRDICSACSGGAMDGITLCRNPCWSFCPVCGRKLDVEIPGKGMVMP
jgi:hypothetical protein